MKSRNPSLTYPSVASCSSCVDYTVKREKNKFKKSSKALEHHIHSRISLRILKEVIFQLKEEDKPDATRSLGVGRLSLYDPYFVDEDTWCGPRAFHENFFQMFREAAKNFALKKNQPLPEPTIKLYKRVATRLSNYTVGELPKAFKHIPSMTHWEDVLSITQPENWSPNAVYQATRIFSFYGAKMAERFYSLVLLPRIREDIRKNKWLHLALYHSLKMALYKLSAFFNGILFPMCESRTCTLREAVIIGSIIEKISIPPLHSSVTLLKLAEMDYCDATSYFIKLFLKKKKYALPYHVIDALVDYFMKFANETRIMPVIWHQTLLTFVQRYKNVLQKEDKYNLKFLLEMQMHKLVTPEVGRKLNHSYNRGEKEDDLMSISCSVSVINKTIEEVGFDISDVPMED